MAVQSENMPDASLISARYLLDSSKLDASVTQTYQNLGLPPTMAVAKNLVPNWGQDLMANDFQFPCLRLPFTVRTSFSTWQKLRNIGAQGQICPLHSSWKLTAGLN